MDFLSALVLAAAPGAVVPFVRPAAVDTDPVLDESELIHNAIAGQRLAQHTLYVRYYERIRTRISRLLGRSAEVDDVLQDTFVAAFRDLKQLADGARFGNWVCGIAVHQVHRRLRRRKLLQRLGLDQQVDELALSQAVSPTASPETLMLLRQLDHALSTLAPRPRVAWLLRYVEGCSLEEVAEQCRVSIATAKRDITQAESRLNAQQLARGSQDER